MVGPLTRQCIQQVHFSKAFIGVDGWQSETGFTGHDMMRADVVNAVLEKTVRGYCAERQLEIQRCASHPLGPIPALQSLPIIICNDTYPASSSPTAVLTVDIVNPA